VKSAAVKIGGVIRPAALRLESSLSGRCKGNRCPLWVTFFDVRFFLNDVRFTPESGHVQIRFGSKADMCGAQADVR
jgi:hypothetical protein